MKNYLALFSIAAALYLSAAYTQSNEPAGKWLHSHVDHHVETIAVRIKRLPLMGLLKWDAEQPPQTPPAVQYPLEVVSPTHAGYTAADLAEIYPSH